MVKSHFDICCSEHLLNGLIHDVEVSLISRKNDVCLFRRKTRRHQRLTLCKDTLKILILLEVC